jgi:hypothetical protein
MYELLDWDGEVLCTGSPEMIKIYLKTLKEDIIYPIFQN